MATKLGFTLFEILVVIFIISVLSIAIFFALNPLQRMVDARNSKRLTSVDNIRKAIELYRIDNKGALPNGIDGSVRMLGTAQDCATTFTWLNVSYTSSAHCLDISTDLTPYLKLIPIDPKLGDATHSYFAIQEEDGKVEIMSMGMEDSDNTTAPDITLVPSPSSSPLPSPSPTPALSSSLIVEQDWGTGYCVEFTIQNNSPNPINSWQMTVNINNSTIDNDWNANFTNTGGSVYVLTPLSWNSTVPANSTISDIGICGTAIQPSNYLPTLTSISE